MVTLHETPFILEYRIAFRLHFVERLANDADFMHLMSTHLSLMHVAPFWGFQIGQAYPHQCGRA